MSSSKDTTHPEEDGFPHDPTAALASPTTPTPEGTTSISNLVPGKKTSSRLSRSSTAKDAKDGKTTPLSTATIRATSPPIAPNTTIDPLTQQIFMRTNTDHTIPQRLRPVAPPESPVADNPPHSASDLSVRPPNSPADASKDKKKGVSFLSRLSMRGGKKRDDAARDTDSQVSDHRTDGRDAQVFSTAVAGGGGFIPHHKEPPRYIRVRANNKKTREFNRMFLAQELVGTQPLPAKDAEPVPSKVPTTTPPIATKKSRPQTGGAIWSAKFSLDGKYLAAAGRDQVVRVWAVISTHEERREHEEDEMAAGESDRLSAPVFRNQPVHEFRGHTGEVLDLSWSKNNFLLSSSMDKTVRLWHMSRKECLCIFTHKDFVTSIAFHPRDDRFFLAGSLDSVLRLWSIPDKSVAFSAQLPDMITAVAFSPDGKTAIAGGLTGLCHFYETEGLKLQSQTHVRSSRGKNAKGSKITGIQTMAVPPDSEDGEVKVLITSNDSRIRIYNLKDKAMDVKFKGHQNVCSQTAASFSDDAHYIICGSEDRRAFVWNTSSVEAENKDKRPYECFDAHSDAVTVALFAPTKTRQLLGASGDPIYDLCNPPPVTLVSLEESASIAGQSEDHTSEIIIPHIKKPEESPAYIARSTHFDGNIIVTADHTGIIKVFRQDCAWAKRRHESWDTGSLSRKFGSQIGVGRTASILTKTSGSHSRKNSLTTSHGLITPQLSSDRILSWRDGVGENGRITPTRSERSLSPHKAGIRTPLSTTNVVNLASEARKAPYAGSPLHHHHRDMIVPTSPTGSLHSIQSSIVGSVRPPRRNSVLFKRPPTGDDDSERPIPTPSFSLTTAADDEPSKQLEPPVPGVTSFWGRWKGISTLTTLRGNAGGSSQTISSDSTGLGHRSTKGELAGLADSPVIDSSPRRRGSAVDTRAEEETDETSTSTPETPKMKEKRRKSVGFINVRSRNSAEGPATEPPEIKGLPPRRQSILRNKRQSLSAGYGRQESEEESPSSPPASNEYRSNESRPRNALPGSSPSTPRVRLLEKEGKEPLAEPSATSATQRDSVATTGSSEGEDMKCSSCGGREFKVRHVKGTMRQRFLCGKCGTLVHEVGN